MLDFAIFAPSTMRKKSTREQMAKIYHIIFASNVLKV